MATNHPAISHEARNHISLVWRDAEIIIDSFDENIVAGCAHLLDLDCQAIPAGSANPDIELASNGAEYKITINATVRTFARLNDLRMYLATMISSMFVIKTKAMVVHAGGILHDDRAVLFSGPGRAGKSTLALTAWQNGHVVIGDDWLAVDPVTLNVEAFPKPLKLRVQNLSQYKDIAAGVDDTDFLAGMLEGEQRLIIGRRTDGMMPLNRPVPIAGVSFLDRRAQGDTTCRSISGRDALQSLFAQIMAGQTLPGAAAVRLVRILSQTGNMQQISVGEGQSRQALDHVIALAR